MEITVTPNLEQADHWNIKFEFKTRRQYPLLYINNM